MVRDRVREGHGVRVWLGLGVGGGGLERGSESARVTGTVWVWVLSGSSGVRFRVRDGSGREGGREYQYKDQDVLQGISCVGIRCERVGVWVWV